MFAKKQKQRTSIAAGDGKVSRRRIHHHPNGCKIQTLYQPYVRYDCGRSIPLQAWLATKPLVDANGYLDSVKVDPITQAPSPNT